MLKKIIKLHLDELSVKTILDYGSGGSDWNKVGFDKDTNFIIESIEGQIDYPNNISECYYVKNKIYSEVKEIFSNVDLESYSGKHQADKTGKSLVEAYEFKFNDKSEIRIACTDFSENVTYNDYLMIAINSKKFMQFINNDAY